MIDELVDKWRDVIECTEKDEYLEREMATEFIEDLTWLKKSLVKQ